MSYEAQFRFPALPRVEYGQSAKQRQSRVGQRDPEIAESALARECLDRGITDRRRSSEVEVLEFVQSRYASIEL